MVTVTEEAPADQLQIIGVRLLFSDERWVVHLIGELFDAGEEDQSPFLTLGQVERELSRVADVLAAAYAAIRLEPPPEPDPHRKGPDEFELLRLATKADTRVRYLTYSSPLEMILEAAIRPAEAAAFTVALSAGISRVWNIGVRIRRDRAQLEAERARFDAERAEEIARRVASELKTIAMMRAHTLGWGAGYGGPIKAHDGPALVDAEIGDAPELIKESQQRRLAPEADAMGDED